MKSICLFWFRRDLRLYDNRGLFHALTSSAAVQAVFIFDTTILDKLIDKDDARVSFIHAQILELDQAIKAQGSFLDVRVGEAVPIFSKLLEDYTVDKVICNRDYEPAAIARDAEVEQLLNANGVAFHQYKDQVVFEQQEIVKKDGTPYIVFTPYKNRWLQHFHQQGVSRFDSENHLHRLRQASTDTHLPELAELGFRQSTVPVPSPKVSQTLIKAYQQSRDYPARKGTSRLGVHFRFGTISIREKAVKAASLSETFLNELIWRDFYAQILANFPYVVDSPFKRKYRNIPWRNDKEDFQHWCDGLTGYPIVDAGMRELKTSGFMHNRVRMITASFLCKHLLINWQWGEAHFARYLLDFDLASNNGGWQWAAGCGTDAAPYFRIFNPTTQTRRFDEQLDYIRHWLPEFESDDYPPPIVDHKFARERCLATYRDALENSQTNY